MAATNLKPVLVAAAAVATAFAVAVPARGASIAPDTVRADAPVAMSGASRAPAAMQADAAVARQSTIDQSADEPLGEQRLVAIAAQADNTFSRDWFQVDPGEEITVELQNLDYFGGDHDLVLELGGGNSVRTRVLTGFLQTDSVDFTAPATLGGYVYYSSVGNDRHNGMEGTMWVGDPPTATAEPERTATPTRTARPASATPTRSPEPTEPSPTPTAAEATPTPQGGLQLHLPLAEKP
jgi:plastocyanin